MAVAGNLVNPTILNRLAPAMIVSKFNLYQVGVAALEFPSEILGEYYRFRRWKALSGSSVVNDGSTSGTATAFAQAEEKGVVNKRYFETTFHDAQISQALNMGADQFTASVVTPMYADYWVREFHRLTTKVLTGMFTTSGELEATHLVTATEAINYEYVVQAQSKLGEAQFDLGAMFVHSDVFHDMKLEAKVEWLDQIGEQRLTNRLPVYEGMVVHVDDNLPTSGSGTTKTYDSYLLAPGSLQFAISGGMRTYESEATNPPSRNVSLAVDFVIHVNGMVYAAATLPPTDAALAAAASWDWADSANKQATKVVCVKSYSSLNA